MRRLLITWMSLAAWAPAAHALDLEQVMRQAATYDPVLNSADYLRYAAHSDKSQTCRHLWPQITLGASYTNYDQDEAGSVLSDTSVNTNGELEGRQAAYSATITQTLWSMPQFVACRADRIRANRNDATYERAFEDFLTRVIGAYMDLLRARSDAATAAASSKLEAEKYAQAKKSFDNRTIAAWELDAASAEAQAAEADKLAAENHVMDATQALEEIAGGKLSHESLASLKDIIPVAAPQPLDPEHWVALAEKNSLALQESSLDTELAQENVAAARAEMWPTADLFARRTNYDSDIERTGPTFANDDGNFTTDAMGVRVRWKFFTGGSNTAGVDAAKYRRRAAEEQHKAALQKVRNRTRESLAGIVSSIATVRAKRTLLDSMRSYHEGISKGQEVGTSTTADLLEAERRLLDAESQYDTARYAYLAARLEFYKAIGALSADTVREINALLTVGKAKAKDAETVLPSPPVLPTVAPQDRNLFHQYVNNLLVAWRAVQWK